MTAKTQPMESSDAEDTTEVPMGRRVADELRLRELELETNFQIQTLSQSLSVLKSEFHSWRDSLNEKISKVETEVNSLKMRVNVIIALVVAQMSDAPALLARFFGG